MPTYVKNRPNLTAGLLFLALTLIFFGRVLFPAEGMLLGGYDLHGYYHILHNAVRQAIHTGQLPLWDPHRYNGTPLLADPQISALYPLNWLIYVLPTNVAVSWFMVVHVWLAAYGMYRFCRQQFGHLLPAVLAGVVFGFSGFLGGRLWAGHTIVVAAMAWTPLLLAATEWAVRGKWWRGVLAAIPFGMAILAGHVPSFLYVGLIWGLFVLYLLAIEPHKGRVIAQSLIIFVVGLALTMAQMIPFLQASAASARVADASFEFATNYSLPPAHLITLLVPEFFGEPTVTGYWSVPTFEELSYYVGMLSVLGLVLALRKPDRRTWFWLVVAGFGLMLALGKYGVLYRLFFDLLPPFRVVRAPGRATFIFLFAVCVLLAQGLGRWQSTDHENDQSAEKQLRGAVLVGLIVGIAALAATGAVFMSVHPSDTSGRLWHQIGGYSNALLSFLVSGALLLTMRKANGNLRTLLAVVLIGVTVIDMWQFSYKFVRLEPAHPDALWADAAAVIGDDEGRVLPWGAPIFSQNQATQVQLNSVFGYVPIEPANHIEFVTRVPDPRSSAYDVLATKFVIAPVSLDQFAEGDGALRLIEQRGGAFVYERPQAVALARVVHSAEILPTDDDIRNRVHEPAFDTQTTALLTAEPSCTLNGTTPPSNAIVEEARAGYWRIRTNATADGLLLLAENDFAGWEARVDGVSAEKLTAFTTIKAVCVPAGEHVVEWRFAPSNYWVGFGVSTAAWVLVGAAFVLNKKRDALQTGGVHKASDGWN